MGGTLERRFMGTNTLIESLQAAKKQAIMAELLPNASSDSKPRRTPQSRKPVRFVWSVIQTMRDDEAHGWFGVVATIFS